jgi:hypothetical protein
MPGRREWPTAPSIAQVVRNVPRPNVARKRWIRMLDSERTTVARLAMATTIANGADANLGQQAKVCSEWHPACELLNRSAVI